MNYIDLRERKLSKNSSKLPRIVSEIWKRNIWNINTYKITFPLNYNID